MSQLERTGSSMLMRLEPARRHLAVWKAAWSFDKRRPKLSLRLADELAFLPAVIEIVETPPSPAGRATGMAIVALFAAALGWAWLGQVDIHATAQGRFIAGGNTKPVAASETATVAAIDVVDGQHVTQGQVLVELDPTAPQADVARLERERLDQTLIAAGLRSLLDGRAEIVLAADLTVPAEVLAVHRAELLHKLADHHASIAALQQEQGGRQAEASGVATEIARLAETVPLLEERVKAKQSLARDGFGTRSDYLSIKQEWIDRRQQLETARHHLTEVEAGVANAGERLRQAEAQFRADRLVQLAEAEAKAASLTQDLAKAQQKSRLTKLTAPVTGVVQQVSVHAAGAVVAPGTPVLMIVPEDEGIAIEAALPNRDAGFVLPGQAVEIKVASFPFTHYGTISGQVLTVSGDAIEGPDASSGRGQDRSSDPQEAVYAVRIKPLVDHIHADGRDVKLAPGMAVTAEIKTGKRRVIDYLLDPLIRLGDESLRER